MDRSLTSYGSLSTRNLPQAGCQLDTNRMLFGFQLALPRSYILASSDLLSALSMAKTVLSTKSSPINGYLRHKKQLVSEMTTALAPLVHALIRALSDELRKYRPQTADAALIEMLLSNVGIDDETRASCEQICAFYGKLAGVRIQQHHLDVVEDEIVVTLELVMSDGLMKNVWDVLSEEPVLPIRVQLHSAASIDPELDWPAAICLELADLEVLHSAVLAFCKDSCRSEPPQNGCHSEAAA